MTTDETKNQKNARDRSIDFRPRIFSLVPPFLCLPFKHREREKQPTNDEQQPTRRTGIDEGGGNRPRNRRRRIEQGLDYRRLQLDLKMRLALNLELAFSPLYQILGFFYMVNALLCPREFHLRHFKNEKDVHCQT